ncbi:response regulator transcription factor [Bacillus cereus]|nr:response regulator transcription factor [Bacillus cereus]
MVGGFFMSERILLVSNNEFDTKLIKIILMQANYKVITLNSGLDVLEQIKEIQPHLIILDATLPGMNGIDVYHQLQKHGFLIPTVILINKEQALNKIGSLAFVNQIVDNRTFSVVDFPLEVRSILHRTARSTIISQHKELYQYGNLIIDVDSREVYVRNKIVTLTPKEFDLLRFLAQNPGRVYNRDILFHTVWGREHRADTRSVDVHIAHLREKIELDPKKPEYIQTVRKIGYKMAIQETL